jgi:two-component system, NarL family, nitrate/nitrite response regulator NarL
MQDIFISTLPAPLSSWTQALPKSKFFVSIPQALSRKNDPIIFWLHMNEDRQQWLTNTLELILKEYQAAKIVVLADMPNHAESLHALSLGATGYCHAYIDPNILKEIRTVISNGGIWIGQELLQRLIKTSTARISNQPEYVEGLLALLTKREKDVAIEAAKGLSNKEIARILNITERTVKAHLAATFERLRAKDRLHLALMLNTNFKI